MHDNHAEDDLVIFEDAAADPGDRLPPWSIAIIDDEPSVHEATRLALEGLEFEGRGFRLLSAFSAAEGRQLLQANPDVACILLDVVMETSHAGLDLADEIRNQMHNTAVRIVLRTGQPGYSPPLDVLKIFDINDYREKTELTRTRLWSTVACALRNYAHIRALERHRDGLETVISSSAWLMNKPMADFSAGVVLCLAHQLELPVDGLICAQQKKGEIGVRVIGGIGIGAAHAGQPLDTLPDEAARAAIRDTLERRADAVDGDSVRFFLDAPEWSGVVFVRGTARVDDVQMKIVRLFCNNAGLGLENVRLLETLSRLAYVDRLTGLSSRARLDQTVAKLTESSQVPMAAVVNIDNFLGYNQKLGWEFGEAVLIAFSERMRSICKDPDRIGRLYGDVFCLVAPEAEFPQDFIARLSEPLDVGGSRLRLGVTCGEALSNGTDSRANLIQRAEIAVKAAKTNRRGSVVRYSADLEEVERQRAALASDLREALIHGQNIHLVYQPQMRCRTGSVRSVEALARWVSPQWGAVPPSQFIPTAEATGMIDALGLLVLRNACHEMKPLIDEGWIDRIAVNVSPLQLKDQHLFTRFADIIREEGLQPRHIEIEITESAALSGNRGIAMLDDAKSRGHRISMDDFGTGYSSLSMLSKMPLDVVKIDQTFVSAGSGSPDPAAMVKLIAQIARQFNLECVLEGVETDAHRTLATEAGVEIIQGFLVARPMPAADLAPWLVNHNSRQSVSG